MGEDHIDGSGGWLPFSSDTPNANQEPARAVLTFLLLAMCFGVAIGGICQCMKKQSNRFMDEKSKVADMTHDKLFAENTEEQLDNEN